MAQSYTRQSTFSDGDTITASLFNNEYNQLLNAFSYSSSSATTTGHRHDGTAGEGGNIHTIGDLDFLNKIVVDSTNNRWGVYVEVSGSAVEQVRIQDGAIVPVTDNDIDLGTSSLEFKDLYLDGTATIDTLAVDANATVAGTLGVTGATTLSSTLGVTGATTLSSTLGVTGATTLSSTLAVTGTSTLTGNVTTTNDLSVGGDLTVTGNATIAGNLTFGDAATDTVSFSADVSSSILPSADNTYDLGATGSEWRDLYIDGTANIDSLVADTADINAGTIDNTAIGGSTASSGAFTTLTASGATTLSTTLGVTGATTLSSTLAVTGAATLSSNLTVNGNTTLGNAASDTVTVTADVASNLIPSADSTYSLGDSSNYWSNGYIDAVTTTGDVSVGGNLTVTGNATISGNLTFGDAATDTVSFSADVSSNLLPSADNTYDLGASGSEWKDLYIDGTAYVDAIDLNGTAITATAAELNILDGVTATAAELNILDGVTATAAELNILDGVTSTAAELNILDGVTSTAAELNILDGVTATTAELNILDGVTSTAAELNILDGVTSTTAELNILDGVTSTASELNILDGVTSTAAELNLLDGSTANTVVNSKAVVYGSSGELAGTLSTAAQTNVTSLGTLSSLTVSGDLTVDTSTLKVDSSNNRVGILNTSPDVSLDIGSATDAVHVPVGTTAQRPGSPAAGYFRYNTSLAQFEGYTDAWGAIGGGGTNTFTHDVFTCNGSTTAFTLSQSTESENNLIVFVDGVFQEQGAYSIATSGGVTTLTMSAAPANGRKLVVYTVAAGVSGSNLNIDTMTGDGSDTTLTLSINPVNENNTQVFIDGVYQSKSNYSISGTTLTFSTAPPNGSSVEVMTMTQTDINVPVDGTITSAKLSGDLTAPGALTSTGVLTANAGVVVDNITIDGTEIDLSSGDLTIDVAGSITLDSDGGVIDFDDAGTNIGRIENASSDFKLESRVQDKDIVLVGNDGGTGVEALRLDMSAKGLATFNDGVILKNELYINNADGSATAGYLYNDSNDFVIRSYTSNQDIIFKGNDGGSVIEAMRIDMSASGNVGIGTSSPTVGKLQVNDGSGATVAITRTSGATSGNLGVIRFGNTDVDSNLANITAIQDGATNSSALTFETQPAGGATTERMRIDSSGNVQIGNSAYGANLGQLRVVNDASSTPASISLMGYGNVTDSAEVGKLEFALQQSGTGGQVHAKISGLASGTSEDEGQLAFYTSDNTLTERMRIDEDGNVGIGSSNPAGYGKFVIQGAGNLLNLNATSGVAYQAFYENGTGRFYLGTLNGSDGLAFIDADGSTERMRIDSDGNVGIGTASPALGSGWSRVLHVNGTGSGAHLQLTDSTTGATNGDGLLVGQYQSNSYFINRENGFSAFYTNNTEAMRIDSSGNLLVGTTSLGDVNNLSTNHLFEGASSTTGSGAVGVYNNTGTANCPALVVLSRDTSTDSTNRFIQFYANVTSSTAQNMGGIVGNGVDNVQFASISDAREKTNIQSISGSLTKINALRPVEFDWIASGEHVNAGFVAQEVEQVFPEFVVENMAEEGAEERKGLTGGMTGGIVAHLVKAIQEQQDLIESLTARISQLEGAN